jgi:hypothetical protein
MCLCEQCLCEGSSENLQLFLELGLSPLMQRAKQITADSSTGKTHTYRQTAVMTCRCRHLLPLSDYYKDQAIHPQAALTMRIACDTRQCVCCC